MIRIYADFNNRDEQNYVRLNCLGSIVDIRANENQLHNGDIVLLYVPDEFEVQAQLIFDGIWRAMPMYDSIKFK